MLTRRLELVFMSVLRDSSLKFLQLENVFRNAWTLTGLTLIP